MSFPYYNPDNVDKQTKKSLSPSDAATERPEVWRKLPPAQHDKLTLKDRYIPDEGLVTAAHVALSLGMPLLLTGEPGVGKTQFAYSLAHKLGLDHPFKFEVKSTTEARDLFYTFDSLGRFMVANSGAGNDNPIEFLEFQALGKAILLANSLKNVEHLLPKEKEQTDNNTEDKPRSPSIRDELLELGFERRSVVLIDEIDKASRDLPNDILNEIEGMYFRIPELQRHLVKAPAAYAPIVVFTSNSEKSLPDTFLRRCAYYHIPFPETKNLNRIIAERVGGFAIGPSSLLNDALAVFRAIQEYKRTLRKRPGVSELLYWLVYLREHGGQNKKRLKEFTGWQGVCLTLLFKTEEDGEHGKNILASEELLKIIGITPK